MSGGLIFLDGNKQNFSKSNLMVVSTVELKEFYRKGYNKVSPDYTKAIFLNLRIEKRLEELKGRVCGKVGGVNEKGGRR